MPTLHDLAEARSLAIHRHIAELIIEDPSLLGPVRARVRRWLEDRSVAPEYAVAWHRILQRDPTSVAAAIVDQTEAARALRQSSPFAGIVDPRTRWRIWREVREAMGPR